MRNEEMMTLKYRIYLIDSREQRRGYRVDYGKRGRYLQMRVIDSRQHIIDLVRYRYAKWSERREFGNPPTEELREVVERKNEEEKDNDQVKYSAGTSES